MRAHYTPRRPLRVAGLGLAAGALFVGGCTTSSPYTQEPQEPQAPQASQAATGTGIGAPVGTVGTVTGWVSGDDRRERKRRALLGLGIGGLTGGSIGYYMDVQEAKLRQQLQGTGVSVTRVGDNVTLSLPGNAIFATDSATLKPSFHGVLDSVGLVLQQYEKTIVEVAGHTDDTGSDEYNQSLSERRAGAVARYLQGRGVIAQRLVTVGVGESRPIASHSTPEGRQQNRRIELTLAPLTAN
jgi:outer membrane protein OmpA-like peptidoglycan-associated protein